jgi:hypothetical protein
VDYHRCLSEHQHALLEGQRLSLDPVWYAFRSEHMTGRIASLGFGAGLIGEVLTGYGPITQLHLETGIP